MNLAQDTIRTTDPNVRFCKDCVNKGPFMLDEDDTHMPFRFSQWHTPCFVPENLNSVPVAVFDMVTGEEGQNNDLKFDTCYEARLGDCGAEAKWFSEACANG